MHECSLIVSPPKNCGFWLTCGSHTSSHSFRRSFDYLAAGTPSVQDGKFDGRRRSQHMDSPPPPGDRHLNDSAALLSISSNSPLGSHFPAITTPAILRTL